MKIIATVLKKVLSKILKLKLKYKMRKLKKGQVAGDLQTAFSLKK